VFFDEGAGLTRGKGLKTRWVERSGRDPRRPVAVVDNPGTIVAFTTRMVTQSRRGRRSAATGSWLALLAAATLGDSVATLQAEVRADGLRFGPYRLVVQSYDATDGPVPGRYVRPVGSIQRAVTAEELRDGVRVELLELRGADRAERRIVTRAGVPQREAPLVVAWVEAGKPDLEFDGRNARPLPGSRFGSARRERRQDAVQINLNRRIAFG
jgi:hypothetical protein